LVAIDAVAVPRVKAENSNSQKRSQRHPAAVFRPATPPAASKAKVRGVSIPNNTVTLDMIAVTK
jgi:hypothetical protein